MGWTIDSTRIFVQDITQDVQQTIARLQPLASGTVYQVFGYELAIIKINAYVVGATDINALRAMSADGVAHTLTDSYTGGTASVYVKSITTKRVRTICQTIRSDLATDSPVYTVDLELYKIS